MNTMNRMRRDFAAFRARLSAAGPLVARYEMRDAPTLQSVSEGIDKIAAAFEEYKKTNDARIEAVKNGTGTADLEAKLDRIEKEISVVAEQKTRLEKLETKLSRPGLLHDARRESEESREAAEYRHALVDWMRAPRAPEREQRLAAAYKAMEKQREADAQAAGRETRATQAVTTGGASGGYALPEVIERVIARIGRDISPIRQIATVRTVGTPDYKELVDINGAGFEWVGETDARKQTDTPDLFEVAPTFGMASAKPQAAEESLDDLFFDVEGWLVDSASEAIAQGEGAAFVAGNGTKKPTGFLAGPAPLATADSARAFGTLQFIASGAAGAMPANPDVLIDLVYSLRARYRANARWVTSRLVLAALRKYKSTDGQYLWQPALAAGQPSLFMGYPVAEMEDMPAVAANSFPLAFGDFKEGYLIADRVGMRVTRDEITQPGFVKFYIRRRVGGKLRNTEAIKLLKIAA